LDTKFQKFINFNKILLLTILILKPIFSHADQDRNNIKLSNNINLNLSKNWKIINQKTRETLKKKVDELIFLKISSSLPFAANLYRNGRVIGIMNIRVYPNIEIYQNEIRKISRDDLTFFDSELYKNVKKGVSLVGAKILHWKGSKLEIINNKIYIVSNYNRSSINKNEAIFNVKLFRLLDGKKSFTLTLSYDEKFKNFMLPEINKIAESINY